MAGISIINTDPNAAPVREGRQRTGTLTAINSGVVLPVNGDQSALIFVNGLSPVLTVVFEGSGDGVNYIPLPAIACYGVGGTLPNFAQPLALELYAAAVTYRVYQVRCANFRYVRVRASTYTSGAAEVVINADTNDVTYRNLDSVTSVTLAVTATGAAGATVTASLPAVAGLRHYVTEIRVTRSATTALAASATPTVITTTNLPGAVAFTMGLDASGIGIDKEVIVDFGDSGFAANAVGTATTVVCPILAGAIWRVNVFYRLGA